MAKRIGELVPAIRTGSPAPSTARSPEATASLLDALPARLDDEQLALVEGIATAPLPPVPAVSRDRLDRIVRFARAMLPSRAASEFDGEIMLAAHRRMLGHLPEPALQYAAEEAIRTRRWFPLIAEWLELAADWRRDDEALRCRRRARAMAEAEREARLPLAEPAPREPLTQERFDALPEHLKRLGVAAGAARRVGEAYVVLP